MGIACVSRTESCLSRSIYLRCRAAAMATRARERWRARNAADLTQRRSALRLLLPQEKSRKVDSALSTLPPR